MRVDFILNDSSQVVCYSLKLKLKDSLDLPHPSSGLCSLWGLEGERGDSNPRIAAPQAAALTTWRRPPRLLIIYQFNINKAKKKVAKA